MAPQGELEEVRVAQEQAKIKALVDELDRRCKEVAQGIKREELATANDVTFQAISKMLNTNGEQSCFTLKYVPSIALKNPDKFAETVLFFLCDMCGREHPDKKRPLTAEEENKLLKEKLRAMKLDQHPDFEGLM
jgi:hypothetical protein